MEAAQALPILVRLLRAEDEDPVVLQTVAQHADADFDLFVDLTLGNESGPQASEVIPRVARFMHHPDLSSLLQTLGRSSTPEVRRQLALLWRHRPELITEASLLGLSQDPVPEVRLAAVQAWRAAGRFDYLAHFFQDPDADVRRQAVLELRSATDGPDPAALLGDSDERVRAAAWSAQVLRGQRVDLPGDIGHESAAAVLREVVSTEDLQTAVRTSPDTGHRITAGIVLAILHDPLAREVARNDPVPEVREQVSRMLLATGQGE